MAAPRSVGPAVSRAYCPPRFHAAGAFIAYTIMGQPPTLAELTPWSPPSCAQSFVEHARRRRQHKYLRRAIWHPPADVHEIVEIRVCAETSCLRIVTDVNLGIQTVWRQ